MPRRSAFDPTQRRPLRIRVTLDDGIAPYLLALVNSPCGIFGDERETIVYAVRTMMIDLMKPGSGFRPHIIARLPLDLQKAWPDAS